MKPDYSVYDNAWYFSSNGEKHGPFRTRKETEIAIKFFAVKDVDLEVQNHGEAG